MERAAPLPGHLRQPPQHKQPAGAAAARPEAALLLHNRCCAMGPSRATSTLASSLRSGLMLVMGRSGLNLAAAGELVDDAGTPSRAHSRELSERREGVGRHKQQATHTHTTLLRPPRPGSSQGLLPALAEG